VVGAASARAAVVILAAVVPQAVGKQSNTTP
jgi:hypothetical protein